MKYGLTFAAIAAVTLAGCQSEVVMDSRQFAPIEDSYATQAANKAQQVETDQEVQEAVPGQNLTAEQPAQKVAAPTTYAPMTGVKSSGGVSSAGKVVAAGGTYVVCSGDTLGKIAHKHGVKLNALMQANGLDASSAKRIRVGQKLVIPDGKTIAKATKPAAKSAPAAKNTAAAPALEADGRYKVKRGDSPARIAKRFKVKVDDLMAANGLTAADASRMQIGDLLIIPGITKGASLANASAKATETTEQLKSQVVELPSEQPQQQAAAPGNTDTVVVEEVVTTTSAPSGNEDLMADTLMYEVQEESISFADLAIKLDVSVENLRKNNPGVSDPVKRGFSVFYSQEK